MFGLDWGCWMKRLEFRNFDVISCIALETSVLGRRDNEDLKLSVVKGMHARRHNTVYTDNRPPNTSTDTQMHVCLSTLYPYHITNVVRRTPSHT